MLRSIRLIAEMALILMLGSCSYAYSIRAVVINGRLAFVVAPWSGRHPDCVRGVDVSVAKNGSIATPEAGDDAGLVRNGGVYWWEQLDVTSCENPFPIFYGQSLKGVPFDYGGGRPSFVKAKPLIIGHVYEVGMDSRGSGWFRITADRRVENWRSDPVPGVRNAEGYDVTVGEQVPPATRRIVSAFPDIAAVVVALCTAENRLSVVGSASMNVRPVLEGGLWPLNGGFGGVV